MSAMTLSPKARASLAGHLRHTIEGDVLSDDFSRARYATDASPFQTFPALIVLPKTQDDLLAAIELAWTKGVSVIARGGGTGRSGQAVGEGLIIDLSKYLTRMLYFDASAQTCIVEPGLTPGALNALLEPEQVWFPIEIGSAGQATLGGMAATDAIGRRALHYGRMRDNIAACDVVLAHGGEISFHDVPPDFSGDGRESEEAALILDLLEAAESREAAISALSSVGGSQHGYNMRALLPGEGPQNAAAFLAGSEGTLAITKRLELKLARRPTNRAIGVCSFPGLAPALKAVQPILALEPISVELSGRRILEASYSGRALPEAVTRFFRRESESLLLVEFMERNRVELARKLKDLTDLMGELGYQRGVSEVLGVAAQDAVHKAHENGISALYVRTDLSAALAPISEVSLPLEQLALAAENIAALFARHGLDVIWHGHVGVGMLNVRPWLKAGAGQRSLVAIAREAHAIFAEFAGRLSAVEGHGIARSYEMEQLRPADLTRLLEDIKLRFDPQNRLNPGKIVMPARPAPDLMRKLSDPEMAAALSALNCNGTALCRRLDNDVMCPSYRLTREERDSPRGRANTIRMAVGGELGANALSSDHMARAMSLCVGCKGCRSECPRGVDIAQAKIIARSERARINGLSRFELSIAELPENAMQYRRWRHLLNLRDVIPWAARFSEQWTGIAADRPWPHLSSDPFRVYNQETEGDGQEIVIFPDTFNNYFDGVTLKSAENILSMSRFKTTILVPPAGERPYCCGRTYLEVGLLDEARREASRLIEAMTPFTERGVPLVGVEPACILTIRDEMKTMLALDGAAELARNALLFEEAMSLPGVAETIKPRLREIEGEAFIASNCHQHAFGTDRKARSVAGYVSGLEFADVIPGCCGMGTSFGYDPETVDASLKMGEMSLFPQIRKTSRDTLLIADGYGCRKQIRDGTGRTARHTAVLLKLALDAKERFGPADGATIKVNRRLEKRLAHLTKSYFKH
ncbi:MAG: FAD-binding oxidoreductase [Hyphomicrobiales bacterium]|nr:FAD-binding oxidoreductase [Hyphomicrobiales bacterium]